MIPKPDDLIGMDEFAAILGISPKKLSWFYTKQRNGIQVRKPLPKPIFLLSASPIWTIEQAEQYKAKYYRGGF